jgi:putative DNA primase/helicase
MNQQIKADRQRRIIEQQQLHTAAADKARLIWSNAKIVTEQKQHPYLIKKNVQPYQSRLHGNALVISMYDKNEHLVNLQFINTNGSKWFLPGGMKKGCFSMIGKPDIHNPILMSEGWATGSSLHETTGYFIVVAMDAGNLKPVAQVFRQLYTRSQIIICGDNDESGTGLKAASAAAADVAGTYILPTKAGQDWNESLNEATL